MPGDQASIGTPLFYTGGKYPAHYDNALFFSDYARQCLFVMPPGANGLPNAGAVEEFSTQVGGIVDLEIGPDGDLYYLDILAGAVHHISYGGTGNQPPVRACDRDHLAGAVPLTVAFDGSTSTDPEHGDAHVRVGSRRRRRVRRQHRGESVAHLHERGRGQCRAAGPRPSGADERRAHLTVTAGNALPVPTITAPTASTTWQTGQTITFRGTATDAEDGTLPGTALDWNIVLFHCPDGVTCHQHLVAGLDNAASGSFIAPDHEYLAYIEITLTATDSTGATASVTRRIDAQTRTITMHSSPSGIALGLNDESVVTPFVRTVIRNSNNTVSAPPYGGRRRQVVSVRPLVRQRCRGPQRRAEPEHDAHRLLRARPHRRSDERTARRRERRFAEYRRRVVRDRLAALGLTVTFADDNGITAAAATGKQLIVISSTVDPVAVNATFAATAVPLVTWEHMLYDDLGLTADTGAHGVSAAKTDVAITSAGAAHPIGAGLAAGTLSVTTTAQKLDWGKPASGATVIATLPAQSTNATVFVYPTGATMVGRNAPARRVGLFPFDGSATVLTPSGVCCSTTRSGGRSARSERRRGRRRSCGALWARQIRP